jgi:hypothetical protein
MAATLRGPFLTEALPMTMKRHQPILRILVVIALLVVAIWPAIYNGQPLLFPDTTGYIRGADAGFSRLIHHESVWSNHDNRASSDTTEKQTLAQPRTSISSLADKTVLAGRSIYYGALLYLGQVVGRFWPAVLVQAGCVLVAIALTLETLHLFNWFRLSIIVIVLALATPLAFFASYLMPDIFAGISILGVANLLVAGSRMTRWILAVWLVLLTAALLFHTSHLLITVALLAATLVARLIIRFELSGKAVAAIVAAVAVAVSGEMFFNVVTKKVVGAPPLRPPFVMARMIVNGPGYRYLVHDCPQSGLAICQFVPRLPGLEKIVTTRPASDEFLWNTDPAVGVFAAADATTQRKLAEEQYRFVKGALVFDASGVVVSWLEDAWRQIEMFTLADFAYDAGGRAYLHAHVPEPFLSTLETTRVWQDALPLRPMSLLTILSTVLSLVVLSAMAIVRRKSFRLYRTAFLLAGLLVAGTVVNGILCGTVSGPHDRYQARVIWLLPLAAMLVEQALANALARARRVKSTVCLESAGPDVKEQPLTV